MLVAKRILHNTLPLTFSYVCSQDGTSIITYVWLAFIDLSADQAKPALYGSILFEYRIFYRIFVCDNHDLMIPPSLTTAPLNWLLDLVEV